MIIGMVPMLLGLGAGGEQDAPLGRAVIDGLLLATVATLVFVPTVFSLLHARRAPRRVALVRNGAAELAPITIGRDYGDRVEVLTGLDTADEVILNPSDSLVSGMVVRLANHKAGGAG
jgi:multidrug efflux pump subunit AcrA (membrane-fusion protein)